LPKPIVCCVTAIFLGVAALYGTGHAQSGQDIAGTWTGTAQGFDNASRYTVILTITPASAKTEYPELNCAGTLTRLEGSGHNAVSAPNVVFTESLAPTSPGEAKDCFDVLMIVARDGDKLNWSRFGFFESGVYSAQGVLAPKE
jgi:hypothetical protein